MPINISELLQSKTPYAQLDTQEKLTAIQDKLNALDPNDKKKLAANIVKIIPNEVLTGYIHTAQSFIKDEEDNESFFYVLSNSCQVKKLILDLMDYNNKDAYKNILAFTDMLNEFNPLALDLMRLKECTMAENLAVSTPKEHRSAISRQISCIFPGSDLFKKIQEAFILQRRIEEMLLGEKPEEFFTHKGLDVDHCCVYSRLLNVLDKPRIEQIGNRLFAMETAQRKNVREQLELLSSGDYPGANPFWQINEHISSCIEATKPAPPLARHPSRMFGSRTLSTRTLPEAPTSPSPSSNS